MHMKIPSMVNITKQLNCTPFEYLPFNGVSDFGPLGKRELICLLVFTRINVVSVGFLFLCVLGMGCVILLWHYLSLPLIIFLKFKNPVFSSSDKSKFHRT